MATTNYKIAQPELDDFYNITITNDNMDIVDNALNMLETKKNELVLAINDINNIIETLNSTLTNVELAITDDVVKKYNVTWGDLAAK